MSLVIRQISTTDTSFFQIWSDKQEDSWTGLLIPKRKNKLSIQGAQWKETKLQANVRLTSG